MEIYIVGMIVTFILMVYTDMEGDMYKDIYGKQLKYDYKLIVVLSLFWSLMWPLALLMIVFDIISLIRKNRKIKNEIY